MQMFTLSQTLPAPSPTTLEETINLTPNSSSHILAESTSPSSTPFNSQQTEPSPSSPTFSNTQQTESSSPQSTPQTKPSSTQPTTQSTTISPPPQRHSTRQHTIPVKFKDYHYKLSKIKHTAQSVIKFHHTKYINYSNIISPINRHLITTINNTMEPQSYTQAAKDVRWVDAMSKELHALEANNTWIITSLPPDKTPIGSKWEGVDYNEAFALVAKMVTVRTFLATAVSHKWHIAQLDINNAFLHGDHHKEVYMTLPQDTSLLTYKKDADFLALVIYVDDILLAGNNNSLINCLKHQLDIKFSIKDLGNLNYYLGIEFLRNKTGITMTQRKYALELLSTTGILDVKPSHIPIDPNIKLNDTDGDPLQDASLYKTLVGKLFYLTITRPDLSYAALIP
nr:hypothetical protein [Tanacetum cinerariifolium]